MNRKLRAEKMATLEAQRILRIQQEETYRYQQAFGPLPDDMSLDAMETLGDFMPLSMVDSLQQPGSLALPNDKPIDSGADSDVMSGHSSDGQDDITQEQLLQIQADDSDSGLDAPNVALQTPTKAPRVVRVGSRSGGESSNGEDADARDIRRYEQRLRNRRANMASTPRSRRSSFTKASSSAAGGSSRRNKSSALSIDVDSAAAGESLGDILGTGTQWSDHVTTPFAVNSPKRSLGNASPTWRPRTRSSRGLPSPFGDGSGGFGISYGESVSLAEQLAAASASTPAMPTMPTMP
ncbi:hypothetical protein GGI21_006702, partial [Coemansia aciculifera]